MAKDVEGLGAYVRILHTRHVGGPLQMAKDTAELLDWTCIMHCWQDKRGHLEPNIEPLPFYAKELHRQQVPVWVWGYPKAGLEDKYIKSLMKADARIPDGFAGAIINAEVMYKWGRKTGKSQAEVEDRAHRLGAAVRKVACQRPVLLSTYGAFWYHKTLPFDILMQYCDGISGQTYPFPLSFVRRIANRERPYGKQRVPSIAGYGPNVLRPRKYLEAHGEDCKAAIIWDYRKLLKRRRLAGSYGLLLGSRL